MAPGDMLSKLYSSLQKAFLPEVKPPFVSPERGMINDIKPSSYMRI
jgi:hypothetical protein